MVEGGGVPLFYHRVNRNYVDHLEIGYNLPYLVKVSFFGCC